ncbi:MAG: hypothetical protein QMD01_01575 [Thermodesulfovibrionales bacterium]|nr:hypothetical protein [Thermodesulfovibrionales bacterium]
MDAVWFIVKTDVASCDKVLNAFSDMQYIRIEGRRDNEIILSMDTDDIHLLNQKIEEIQA